MRQSIFILLSILHFGICVGSGVFGWQIQFATIGLSHLLFGLILLPKNPFKKKFLGYLILFLPLNLLYLFTVIGMAFYANYNLVPFLFIGVLTSLVAIAVYRRGTRNAVYATAFAAILILGMSYYLMNYYQIVNSRQSFSEGHVKKFDQFGLDIFDTTGNKLDPAIFKDQVVVIDVWNSRCSACIRSFPKLDALRKQYKPANVKFFTLNVPLNEDDRAVVERYTNKYDFEKLYTTQNAMQKLGLNAVPCTIIVDKDGNVVYMGQIYTEESSLVNNFHRIISKLTS